MLVTAIGNIGFSPHNTINCICFRTRCIRTREFREKKELLLWFRIFYGIKMNFIEFGQEFNDDGIKNKWRFEWISEKDDDGIPFGEWCKKIDEVGHCFYFVCSKKINYQNNGNADRSSLTCENYEASSLIKYYLRSQGQTCTTLVPGHNMRKNILSARSRYHENLKKKKNETESSNEARASSSTTQSEVSSKRKASSPLKEQNCKKICPNPNSDQKKSICSPNPNSDKKEKIVSNSKTKQQKAEKNLKPTKISSFFMKK